jgi:hypothetical protein
MQWAAIVLAAAIQSAFIWAEDRNSSSDEELIRELGSPVFAERERAGQMLRTRGPRALPALERFTSDPDLEIRRRVERLIRAAKAAKAPEPKRVTVKAENFKVPRLELADARARLALVEGRPNDAITELTQVVAGHERIVNHLESCGCLTGLIERLQFHQKKLGDARARLACVEGKPERMAAELAKLVSLQEKIVEEKIERLLNGQTIDPEQLTDALRELSEARSRLEHAKRLMYMKAIQDGGTS